MQRLRFNGRTVGWRVGTAAFSGKVHFGILSSYRDGSWESVATSYFGMKTKVARFWPITILSTKLRSPRFWCSFFLPKEGPQPLLCISAHRSGVPIRPPLNGVQRHLPSSRIILHHPCSVQWGGLCHYAPSRLAWLVQTLRSTKTDSASFTKQPWQHRLGLDGLFHHHFQATLVAVLHVLPPEL